MRYDRIFTKLFCSPLCLEASVRAGFERVLLALMSGKAAALPDITAEEQPRFFAKKVNPARADMYADNLLEIDGKRAIIHIDGAIDRHLSAWDRMCFEATDLNDVNRALARIENDSAIENVLIAINSPGGTVNGVPETAARIAALSGKKKNTAAFIDGMGCSAAYWLACGCDQILGTGSAMSGSVGVYMALLDESRWLEDEGLKVELIKDGKLKAAGASFKPLTEDERGYFQGMVSKIGTMFRAAVTEKRPKIERSTMEGQCFFGDDALKVGLVDGVVPDVAAALREFER